MLTVNYFCVALCKLSSVQLCVQPAHMAIGSNNNAGQCVRPEENLVFYLYSQQSENNARFSQKSLNTR